MFSLTKKLACFKIWVVFGSQFPVNIYFFLLNLCHRGYSVQKTLIRISSLHAASTPWVGTPGCSTISSWSPKNNTKQEQNSDHEQASNSECTEVKLGFSWLLSDDSQIRLKTFELHNLK